MTPPKKTPAKPRATKPPTTKTNDDDRPTPEPAGVAGVDRLPLLPGENVAQVAEIFHASGWFGALTPAQIATLIIVGRSLGLDDSQSAFDLEITDGPKVRYRPLRTHEITADDLAGSRDLTEKEKAGIRKDNPAGPSPSIRYYPPEVTPDPALPAADADPGVTGPGGNVVDGGFTKKIVDLGDAGKFDVSDIMADSANNGPVLDPGAEPSLDGPQGVETMSAAPPDASAGRISDMSTGHTGLIDPAPDLITPDPASTDLPADSDAAAERAAIAEDLSDCSPETVAAWKHALLAMCGELGIDRKEKESTFDVKNIAEKRKMYTDCQAFYNGKVNQARTFVIESLQADGKATTEQQAGFFIYADVGLNPDLWNFTEAIKAQNALSEFLRPPAA